MPDPNRLGQVSKFRVLGSSCHCHQMPSDSRYQVIHSALQQTATATTHRSSLCGVCVCAGLELLVDVHVLTTGVQFPGQHFGAAACGGVLLVRFWNSLCGPILLAFG